MPIDLNSDLGEGYGPWTMGDDAAMLDIVSSANIACGFHAGDPAGLLSVLRQAAARGVAVGAHVSYPDRVGFGRRTMDVAPDDLTADVIYQIGALQGLAQAAGTRVTYVKPHGALYNTIAEDARQADAVIAGVKAVDPSLVLMGLAGRARAEACARRGSAGRGRGLRRPRLYRRGRAGVAQAAGRGPARPRPDRRAHAAPGDGGRAGGRGWQHPAP